MLFLSTLSLRRATQGTRRRRFLYGISIHALLAESDFTSLQVSGKTPISIHALLAESDAARAADTSASCNFYPRSPCGERPQKPTLPVRFLLAFLSTLSLRRATRLRMRKYTLTTFLSTLSLRRATQRRPVYRRAVLISIHALLAESDASGAPTRPESVNFYPRSPCGERPVAFMCLPARKYFYPRSPCGERPADTCSFTAFQ